VSATAIIIGLVSLAITILAVPRLIEGLKSGKMALIGQIRDWGPFHRAKHPIRYWLSVAWAAFASGALIYWLLALRDGGFQ